jgi:hypothetical protein
VSDVELKHRGLHDKYLAKANVSPKFSIASEDDILLTEKALTLASGTGFAFVLKKYTKDLGGTIHSEQQLVVWLPSVPTESRGTLKLSQLASGLAIFFQHEIGNLYSSLAYVRDGTVEYEWLAHDKIRIAFDVRFYLNDFYTRDHVYDRTVEMRDVKIIRLHSG